MVKVLIASFFSVQLCPYIAMWSSFRTFMYFCVTFSKSAWSPSDYININCGLARPLASLWISSANHSSWPQKPGIDHENVWAFFHFCSSAIIQPCCLPSTLYTLPNTSSILCTYIYCCYQSNRVHHECTVQIQSKIWFCPSTGRS